MLKCPKHNAPLWELREETWPYHIRAYICQDERHTDFEQHPTTITRHRLGFIPREYSVYGTTGTLQWVKEKYYHGMEWDMDQFFENNNLILSGNWRSSDESVDRLEVIDDVSGRLLVRYGWEIEFNLQDDGKTLKVFLRERK